MINLRSNQFYGPYGKLRESIQQDCIKKQTEYFVTAVFDKATTPASAVKKINKWYGQMNTKLFGTGWRSIQAGTAGELDKALKSAKKERMAVLRQNRK